jgi:antitoxin component YwqK of YwqJK toxin-antitoxin module
MKRSIYFVRDGVEREETSSGKCLRVFWHSNAYTEMTFVSLFLFLFFLGLVFQVSLSDAPPEKYLVVLLPLSVLGVGWIFLRFFVNYTLIHVDASEVRFTARPLPALFSANSKSFPRDQITALTLDPIARYSENEAMVSFRIRVDLSNGERHLFLDRIPKERVSAAFTELERWLLEDRNKVVSATISPEDTELERWLLEDGNEVVPATISPEEAIEARSRRRLRAVMLTMAVGLGVLLCLALAALPSSPTKKPEHCTKRQPSKPWFGPGLQGDEWTCWPNGRWKSARFWNLGEIEGSETEWYDNGQLHTRIHRNNHKKQGTYEEWYPNGQRKQIGNYNRGSENGVFSSWHENGKKKAEIQYKNGQKHGTTIEYHSNENIQQRKNYYGGALDGNYESWYVNGQKEISGTYQGFGNVFYDGGQKPNYRPVGLWRKWTPTGELMWTARFHEGQLCGEWRCRGRIGECMLDFAIKLPQGGDRKRCRYRANAAICPPCPNDRKKHTKTPQKTSTPKP